MARIETEDGLFERGKRIANDPTLHEGMIGDPPRPLTNMEMHAFTHYRRTRDQQRKERKHDNAE